MGNNLDGAAEVVTTALLLDNVLVDLAGSDLLDVSTHVAD